MEDLKSTTRFDYSRFVAIAKDEASKTLEALKIPYEKVQGFLLVKGSNMIDMMGLLYKNPMGLIYGHTNVPNVSVVKDCPEAVLPTKARESDVGYDLTIIKLHKQISDNILMYDTGIKLQVPWGHYVEVYPRSSLSKTGWMLANSVGIIDSSYTGNIYVVLARSDPTTPELPLPFKGFQLVVRKQHHANFSLTEEDQLTETSRGTGGFGSTDSTAE